MKRFVIPILYLLTLLALIWLPLSQARTVGDAADPKRSAVDRLKVDIPASPPASSLAGATANPQAMIDSAAIEPSQMPPTPSPTPEWTWNPPGNVDVPILLYHHIAGKVPASRYFISPAVFEDHLRILQSWGYTSIPLSLLVQALTEGAFLPPRPVVITFDDGHRDVYTHAYPLMEHYGFTGVVYAIAGQVGLGKYMDAGELGELAAAGWEIGSHSWTHTSLRSPAAKLPREIVESRQALEELLGVPVETFAFPYGLTSKYVTGLVKDAGYQSAVGLGGLFHHTKKTRYYLSRIEVRSNYDLKKFTSLLPWAGDPIDAGPPSNDDGSGAGGQ
jgi:peptidoglycan/xylan/chitin deacetylase (PgdA/CDA1 family)